MSVGFLVLAAGRSRRFGDSDKLLASLDGKPVIAHVLDSLQPLAAPVVVCVASPSPTDSLTPSPTADLADTDEPPDSPLIAYLRTRQQAFVTCPRAHEGMGSTLADAVVACANWSGWIVCLADMPAVRLDTYQAILDQPAPHGLLAPQWQGQRGHPVKFDRRWYAALGSLGGDTGARSLLAQFHEQLALLSVDDPGITLDIDTPSDLNRRLTRQ